MTQLQLTWEPGSIIAWAGGRNAPSDNVAGLRARLQEVGGGSVPWEECRPIKILDGAKADALRVPLGAALGWLVSMRDAAERDDVGASVPWLALTAVMAVRLAAQGRMVPRLKKLRRKEGGKDVSTFEVHWEPALIDPDAINELAAARPTSAAVQGNRQDGRAFTQSVLSDLLGTICEMAAERLEVPAPPPDPRSRTDVAETVLARLDGKPFDAPTRAGAELVRRLDQWSSPVTGTAKFSLTVQLDPPDEGNAWHCSVLAPGPEIDLEPVEVAMVNSSNTKSREMKAQLARVERLFPELSRPGGRRRGEVILSQDEAWQLMSRTGEVLRSAGFDVRVPALSRRKPTPGLRLTATRPRSPSSVPSSWPTCAGRSCSTTSSSPPTEIQRLAAQARPLVKSGDKWVEIDKADLREAAAALAERADKTQLTGADMLRQALGPRGLAPRRWHPDRRRRAGPPTCCAVGLRDLRGQVSTTPEGFDGELRHYQAEAVAWLRFLDDAGLGGCLALDMGLGKTPDDARPRRRRPASTDRRSSSLRRPSSATGRHEARRFTKSPAGRGPPRPEPGQRPGIPDMAEKCRRGHHHLRHRRARRRRAVEGRVGQGRARRGPGHQEPRPPTPPSSCAASRPAAASPSPARRSRTASATCGRSSTTATPASSVVGRSSSPSCRPAAPARTAPRARSRRSTASSCSAAPRPSRPSPRSSPTASTSSTIAP